MSGRDAYNRAVYLLSEADRPPYPGNTRAVLACAAALVSIAGSLREIRAERTCRMEVLPPDETRMRWLCSECSGVHIAEASHYLPPNYCPNCGAKVVSE